MSGMSKTKEKLVDAAIKYLNSEGKEKISVKKLIKIAGVGYGTFYNHFDSVEDIQIEALNKTIKNNLIDFKLDVKNEKDYVYIIYLALFRVFCIRRLAIEFLFDNNSLFEGVKMLSWCHFWTRTYFGHHKLL